MRTLFSVILLFFIVFLSNVLAQNSVLPRQSTVPILQLPSPTKDSIQLRPYMSVYVDSTNNMTLQNAKNQHFIPLIELPLGQRGCHVITYWYRLVVENPSADTVQLSLSFMELYSLTAYTFQAEKLLDSVSVGKLTRPHPQLEKKNYPSNRTLLLYFPPRQQVTVWLKVKKSWCQIPEQPILYNPSVEASFHYKGWSYKEIAAHRFVSEHTVRTQVRSIYYKLQVHTRAELIHKFPQ